MNRVIVSVSLALAQLVVVSAFAAGPGEDKAMPTKQATAEEKAAAKAMRKAEGKEAVKAGVRDDKDVLGKAKVATKEQRKEAAKARKASAKEAMKKGETSKDKN